MWLRRHKVVLRLASEAGVVAEILYSNSFRDRRQRRATLAAVALQSTNGDSHEMSTSTWPGFTLRGLTVAPPAGRRNWQARRGPTVGCISVVWGEAKWNSRVDATGRWVECDVSRDLCAAMGLNPAGTGLALQRLQAMYPLTRPGK